MTAPCGALFGRLSYTCRVDGCQKSTVVDMSPAAVSHRMREVGTLLAQRGFLEKGAPMTAQAVTARLKTLARPFRDVLEAEDGRRFVTLLTGC